jgi:DNA repair protein RecO (recombination protein O)
MPAHVRLYRTCGLVLRQRDLGETDRIITLFTRDQGKVSAVARGTKRANSKLAAGTQLFCHSSFQIAAGRNLDVITQCQVLDSFYELRSDLERFAYASYLCELVDGLTEEHSPSERIFGLLCDGLGQVTKTSDLRLLARVFELRLVSVLGYAPRLANCLQCHRLPADGEAVGLSPALGGLVCADCARGLGRVYPLSAAALRAARICLQAGTAILPRVDLDPKSARQLEQACRRLIEYHLDRQVRSARFLDTLSHRLQPPAPDPPA